MTRASHQMLGVGAIGAGVLALAGTWIASFFPVKDPDLPLHLAYGRHHIETGRVDALEPFSYTASEVPYPNFEWGFDLLVHWLFSAGGADWALGLKLLLLTCVTLLSVMTARRLAPGERLIAGWSAAALWLLALPVLRPRLTLRPHVFAAALLTLHLYLARRIADNEPGRRAWWPDALLVLTIPLWISVHGSWPLAFLITGAHVLFCAPQRLRFIRLGLLQAAALFINPYGLDLITFPFVHVAPPELRLYITEWQPLFHRLWPGQEVVVLGMAAGAFGLLAWALVRWWRDRSRAMPAAAEWACALAFMTPAVVSYRFVLPAALLLIPPMAATLARAMSQLGGRLPHLATALLMVLALGGFFGRLDAQEEPYTIGAGLDFSALPERAADTVVEHGLPGPVFNDFDSGDYLTWRFGPERKIAIDGRFLLYSEVFFDAYLGILKDPTQLDAHVAEHQPQLALFGWTVPRHQALIAYLMKHPDWALIHFDEHQALWARDEARRQASAARLVLERARPAAHPEQMLMGPIDARAEVELLRIRADATPPFGALLEVGLRWRHWEQTGDAKGLRPLVEAADEVVRLRPELLYARLRRGQARLALGEVEAAIRDLEIAATYGAGQEAIDALEAAHAR